MTTVSEPTQTACPSTSEKTWRYSFLGYLSLIMWSFGAVFTALIKNLPVFQTLFLVFSISFLLIALKLTLTHTWYRIKQPWFLWLIGIIGMFGNEYLFIAAFKHAPAVQVDLINYLWPIMVIVFSGLLPNETFKIKYVFAAFIGFYGVFILITNGEGIHGFHVEYWQGYCLAFLEAFVWTAYTLFARHYRTVPTEMVGMYYGVSALIACFFHFFTEPSVMPSLGQIGILCLMGLTTQGAAYLLWDIGVKQGHFKLLSLLSYGNPVLSVFFLVLFGLATANHAVILACLLVSSGAVIGGIEWKKNLKRAEWMAKSI